MMWDDENDSENTQRLKNMVFLKMPFTNKDRDDALPVVAIATVLFIIGAIIYAVVT